MAVVPLALSPPVRAAEEKPPQSRIRVTTVKGRTVGALAEVRGETLVLERPRGERVERVEIRKAEIVVLERSERRSHKGTGAMIGALAGVGAGVVFGLLAGDECISELDVRPVVSRNGAGVQVAIRF